MEAKDIKKVIVVFKTHLDIGFTDYSENVLQEYCRTYIPAAVNLAFEVNKPGQKRFVWTVGSYLIKYYLEHADKAGCERLSEAIRSGFVRWHGLACTTHTELMDRDLIDYDLSISKKLDEQFNMTTIAAKMTDVPGHTIGLIPALCDAGIEYMHIGVNGCSRVPDVPPIFCWSCNGRQIVVNYAGYYGDVTLLENGTALEFYHASDNAAPPAPDELEALFSGLAEKYPNAHIEAGTLEDFALSVREVRLALPVITEEIGDTWIHGAATDPLKVSWFKRLLKLRKKWIADGKLSTDSKEYDTFMENLLLIPEHTWGMDIKKYLLDFQSWDKESFQKARKLDVTNEFSFGKNNYGLLEGLIGELHHYHGDVIESSFSRFESSHQEQRNYITKALASLPAALQEEAKKEMSFTYPVIPENACICHVYEPIELTDMTVTIGNSGEITEISDHAAVKTVSIGKIEYETFGGREVDDCYYEYGRDLDKNYYWAEPDFGKPGLRLHPEITYNCFSPSVRQLCRKGNTIYAVLVFSKTAREKYGCPGEFTVVYDFKDHQLHMEIFWKDKDALRSPEAIWVNINPMLKDNTGWLMNKSGTMVAPDKVVYGGNRKLHSIQSLHNHTGLNAVDITPLDTPLVSPGAKNIYHTDNSFDNLENGFYFNLYNNRWGTNFKMWFEEDMRAAFDIELN